MLMNINLYPFYAIIIFSMITIIIDALSNNKSISYYFSLTALLVTGALSIYSLQSGMTFIGDDNILTKMFVFGGSQSIFDLLFIFAAFLTIYSSKDYNKRKNVEGAEYYSIILMTVFGMMFTAHSRNLLSLFVGIEIVSISFYILTAYVKTNKLAIEAAVKYFLLGSFAAGFLLLGISYLYGATGTLDIPEFTSMISTNANMTFLSIGFALLLIGLFFKTAVMPFHQWAADVYTGASAPITGFMSTAGKAVGIAAIFAVFNNVIQLTDLSDSLIAYFDKFKFIIAIAAAITMIFGNIIALVQQSVKRMLAYSSISHAGYILMGFAAFSDMGMKSMIFYSFVYLFMQMGAFILISGMDNEDGSTVTRENLSGLAKKSPIIAAFFAVFMFALSGLPPFSGFIAKYYLFMSAIDADLLWLTVVAIISTLISIYYYISTIIFMYFKDTENTLLISDKNIITPVVISAIITLILGVYPAIVLGLL